MEMAKVEGSALPDTGETLGGGTGMYEEILDCRDCLWMECSGEGPSGVWMDTARPLKQGMVETIGRWVGISRSMRLYSERTGSKNLNARGGLPWLVQVVEVRSWG